MQAQWCFSCRTAIFNAWGGKRSEAQLVDGSPTKALLSMVTVFSRVTHLHVSCFFVLAVRGCPPRGSLSGEERLGVSRDGAWRRSESAFFLLGLLTQPALSAGEPASERVDQGVGANQCSELGRGAVEVLLVALDVVQAPGQ